MAWPSASARTKNWGTEILTDADLEGQFDLLHSYFNASLDGTSGHAHTGGTSDGPKISAITGLTIASQAQGDILYASSSSAFARLGAGTSGYFLKTQGAAANPIWSILPTFYIGTFDRDETTSSGTSTITGVGFTPRFIYFFGANATSQRNYHGFSDGTKHYAMHSFDGTQYMDTDSTVCIRSNKNTNLNTATCAFNSDGFVLTWTKTGSPTGTLTSYFLAIQ